MTVAEPRQPVDASRERAGSPAPTTPAGEPPAGVWRRVVAWVIDVVAVIVVIVAAAIVIGAVVGPTVRFEPSAGAVEVAVDGGLVLVNALVSAGLSAAYFVVAWVRWGASPGQRLLGLRVRGIGDAAVTPGRAIERWILLLPPFGIVAALTASLPSVSALVWAIAPLWYLVLLVTTVRGPDRRGWHDRWSRTVVRRVTATADVR